MYTNFISVSEFQAIAADCWVADTRHQLMDVDWGSTVYAQAHIPGAVFMHMDRDLSAPKNGLNGRHPLPDPESFLSELRRLGLQKGQQVVVYDQNNGQMASRLWWMLSQWLGHEAVAVLDGGWDAWLTAGGPTTSEVNRPQHPGNFDATVQVDRVVSCSQVLANLNHPVFTVIDARAAVRWAGLQEPIDPVAGRIPGSRNRFSVSNNDEKGFIKPKEQLLAEWSSVLTGLQPEHIVHQCGSGVTSAHNLLTLEYLGIKGSRLYPGSWSEWCADLSRPVERDAVSPSSA